MGHRAFQRFRRDFFSVDEYAHRSPVIGAWQVVDGSRFDFPFRGGESLDRFPDPDSDQDAAVGLRSKLVGIVEPDDRALQCVCFDPGLKGYFRGYVERTYGRDADVVVYPVEIDGGVGFPFQQAGDTEFGAIYVGARCNALRIGGGGAAGLPQTPVAVKARAGYGKRPTLAFADRRP